MYNFNFYYWILFLIFSLIFIEMKPITILSSLFFIGTWKIYRSTEINPTLIDSVRILSLGPIWLAEKIIVFCFYFHFLVDCSTKKLIWFSHLYSVFISSILKFGFEYKKMITTFQRFRFLWIRVQLYIQKYCENTKLLFFLSDVMCVSEKSYF